jgi:hypothetical protein
MKSTLGLREANFAERILALGLRYGVRDPGLDHRVQGHLFKLSEL